MEVIGSSKTLVTTYTTWCHNPKHHNPNFHFCENLKSQIVYRLVFWASETDICHHTQILVGLRSLVLLGVFHVHDQKYHIKSPVNVTVLALVCTRYIQIVPGILL
jgi:hypothetical protein